MKPPNNGSPCRVVLGPEYRSLIRLRSLRTIAVVALAAVEDLGLWGLNFNLLLRPTRRFEYQQLYWALLYRLRRHSGSG